MFFLLVPKPVQRPVCLSLVFRRSAILALTCILGSALAGTAGGQIADSGAAQTLPTLRATLLDQAPELDGQVVNEELWSSLEAASGFTQSTPQEGAPASERTDVYVGYTAEALYVAVVCHDRQADGIVVTDQRRDGNLDDSDSFRLVLDTFDDGRTAFVFGTNPAAMQFDGQIHRDGSGEQAFPGGFNKNWNGDWRVAAHRFNTGWSAELEIPFRTLRFPKGNPQDWGINFQRNIRRHNEVAFWSPIPKQFNLTRVSLAGRLNGVRVPRGQVLQLTPYILASQTDGDPSAEDEEEAGLELKFGITPSLTLDAGINIDFAQVEADVQQLNLDRFNLFFPEKRPFFLENEGIFRVGVPAEVELFFSRRIGLDAGGREIPIDGGLRLSGKAGNSQIGMLLMQTDSVSGSAPEQQFGVVRLSHDLGERSSVGFLVTHREGEAVDDEGQTFAVDGRWSPSQKLELKGFLAQTETPGISGDDHALRLGATWTGDTMVAALNYSEVGEAFDPQVGFVARTGYRKADGFVLWRHRPENRYGIQELRPHVFYRSYWDFDGVQESGYLHLDNHIQWDSGAELHTGVNLIREQVKVPFEIFPGVTVQPGDYRDEVAQLGAFTDRSAPIGFGVSALIGGFFGGDRVTVSPSFRFRHGDKLNGEVVWSHNEIDLEGGSFDADLGRLKFSYAFTPRIFVDGLIQYNNSVDQWSSNIRFGALDNSGTGLYLVYNESRAIGDGETRRRVILKVSKLLNLLR